MTNTNNSYAFVSNGLVIGTITLDQETESYDRKKAGFENTSSIIDITENTEARIGSVWNGSEFIHDDSVEAYIVPGQHRFAFLSEGKVFYIKRVRSVSEGTLKSFTDAITDGISVYSVTTQDMPDVGSAWN
jgi:hypothetical protein